MRRRPLAALSLILISVTAGPAAAQVQYGGYLAGGVVKGQAESDYPRWTMSDVLAGFQASGIIGQKFAFGVEARTLDVSSFELRQAWAAFSPLRGLSLKAGLFLVPFGRWNRASRPHETPLVLTPLNLERTIPESWREIGVLAEGEVGVLSYAAYLGNGLSEPAEGFVPAQQFRDNNTRKAKGGRLGLKLGAAAQAGISYMTGEYDDEGLLDLVLEGVDLAWVTDQWEVHGEYTKALIDNPEPLERGLTEGYSIWMLMSFRSLQPVASFQKVKHEGPRFGGEAGEGDLRDRTRWTLGLRFVAGQRFVVKVEYDWNKEKEPVLKDNLFLVQVALSF